MTRRRNLLAMLGAAALGPRAAFAQSKQTPAENRRIGVLSPYLSSDAAPWHQAFRLGLRELGWVEGKNISIEYRHAEGKRDRIPDLAADLVRLKVDVIVASVDTDALVARRATRTIPIVAAASADAVSTGLADSLARPGGNVTGMSHMSVETVGKRLELLRELVPGLSRVAVVWNPNGISSTLNWKEIQLPARQLGVQIHSLAVQSPNDFDQAFEDAIRARVGALLLTGDPVVTPNLKRIADFAVRNRLPSIFLWSEFADAGGLVTYGADRADLFRRAASYVDKILRGAKPGDLPIDRATKFELVINRKTANALGLTIPQSILVRADRVIE